MACVSSSSVGKRKRLLIGLGIFAITSFVAVGVFASNNWFPRTDPFSGKRYGWFGKELAKNAPNPWNPLAMPSPTPTPQLSKEYIYAGSRLLAVEDKSASAAPPADLAVWRPTNGTWYVNDGTSWYSASWGQSGDTPVPGDYDGDGKTDFSIFRPGTGTCPCSITWYIIHSSTNSQVNFQYAVNGDLPAQADYDGDGKTDPAVYRPSNYTWYIQGSTAGFYTQVWGDSGDVPAPADYDGDGKADMGVWRSSNSTFYSIDSSDLDQQSVAMSQSGLPVSGDYDGDGKADYALFAALGGGTGMSVKVPLPRSSRSRAGVRVVTCPSKTITTAMAGSTTRSGAPQTDIGTSETAATSHTAVFNGAKTGTFRSRRSIGDKSEKHLLRQPLTT